MSPQLLRGRGAVAVRAGGCGVSAATSRALLASSPAPCGDTGRVPGAAEPGAWAWAPQPHRPNLPALEKPRAAEPSLQCSVLRGLGTPSGDGGILCSACPGAQGVMAHPPDGMGAPEGAASSVAPRPLSPLPPFLCPASRSASRAGTQPGKVTRCQHPDTSCHWGRALGRESLPAPPCKRLPISRRH